MRVRLLAVLAVLVLPAAAAAQQVLPVHNAQIFHSDGSASNPADTYDRDTNVGRYRIGADNEGFSAGGALRWDYNTTRLKLSSGYTLDFNTTSIKESEIEVLDGITNGTAAASKALVTDSGNNITGLGNLSLSNLTASVVSSGEGSFSGGLGAAGGFQVSGPFGITPVAGSSIEMVLSGGAGLISARDRSALAFLPLSIDGLTTTINGLSTGATVIGGTLTAANHFGVAATKRLYLDGVGLAGDTHIAESSANVISLTSGGVAATLTSGVLAIPVPGSTFASGSAQFPTGLTISASTHATSRRAGMMLGSGAIGQDLSGNGTLDMFIIESSGKGLLIAPTTGNVSIINAGSSFTLGSFMAGAEQAAPAAPAANGYRLFSQDNGAGKTQLCVIFSSGAAQCFATQP